MDMDMGDMDMGGMDSGSNGLFLTENMNIAKTYWGIIGAVVAILAVARLFSWLMTVSSVRQVRKQPDAVPSKPRVWWQQGCATLATIGRESSYPQPLFFRGRVATHFSFMPTGRWILLTCYWAMILGMMWSNVIMSENDELYAYKWEKVAYRAAWVSVSQVPFIFLMSAKLNVISLLTGISYERLQWLHRWAARTLLLTIAVHWSFFWTEWSLSDTLSMELEMMSMIKWGFGAWGVLFWTVLTSIGLVRDLCYELFVLQHLSAAAVFLWLVFTHIPAYARYNVWMSVAFVAFDWIGRGVWSLYNNVHLRPKGEKALVLGHHATLEALPDGFTRVTVANVGFRWRPGQHVYVSAPTVGVLESHPFTIANDRTAEGGAQDLTLLLKAHGGFTKRLYKRAQKGDPASLRLFLQGPFGNPPDLRAQETLVFLASGSGATFTVPMLQAVARNPACAQSVHFWWIVRHADHLAWFRGQVERAAAALNQRGVLVRVHFVVTAADGAQCTMHPDGHGGVATQVCSCCCNSGRCGAAAEMSKGSVSDASSLQSDPKDANGAIQAALDRSEPPKASCCGGGAKATKDTDVEKAALSPTDSDATAASRDVDGTKESQTSPLSLQSSTEAERQQTLVPPEQAGCGCSCNDGGGGGGGCGGAGSSCLCGLLRTVASSSSADLATFVESDCHSEALATAGGRAALHAPRARPALDAIVRPPVERARGSTAVVACGGAGLVADTRSYVAWLSDQRAVHKGSGAQSIQLWAERGDW